MAQLLCLITIAMCIAIAIAIAIRLLETEEFLVYRLRKNVTLTHSYVYIWPAGNTYGYVPACYILYIQLTKELARSTSVILAKF